MTDDHLESREAWREEIVVRQRGRPKEQWSPSPSRVEDEVVIECNLEGPEYKHPFARYVDFLRDGTEPLRTTEDGFRSQMATLVAQRAANSGETNVPIAVV